jgi:hypothetical protein
VNTVMNLGFHKMLGSSLSSCTIGSAQLNEVTVTIIFSIAPPITYVCANSVLELSSHKYKLSSIFMHHSTQKFLYFFQISERKRGCDCDFDWYGGSDNEVKSLSCTILSTV